MMLFSLFFLKLLLSTPTLPHITSSLLLFLHFNFDLDPVLKGLEIIYLRVLLGCFWSLPLTEIHSRNWILHCNPECAHWTIPICAPTHKWNSVHKIIRYSFPNTGWVSSRNLLSSRSMEQMFEVFLLLATVPVKDSGNPDLSLPTSGCWASASLPNSLAKGSYSSPMLSSLVESSLLRLCLCSNVS